MPARFLAAFSFPTRAAGPLRCRPPRWPTTRRKLNRPRRKTKSRPAIRKEAPIATSWGSEAGQAAIAQLRQGGHYLAPNGTSDALFAAVIAIRNWFALAITTGMALLALFFFSSRVWPSRSAPGGNDRLPAALLALSRNSYAVLELVLIALAFWPASCAWAYWFARSTFVANSRLVRLISMQSLVAMLIFVLALIWPGTGRRLARGPSRRHNASSILSRS